VPDRKRIVAGDAFQMPSGNINYYRDSFLIWPLVAFSIVEFVSLCTPGVNHRLVMKCAAFAPAAILLAHERRILLLGALGFCALRSMISFTIQRE
jgi:hypothetical protein